jgi:lambda family phage portal protein
VNFLDRFISFFSPAAGRRRQRERLRLGQLQKAVSLSGRKYEAASKANRISWLTSDMDANSEINAAQKTIRDRARDLVRNNAFAHKAKEVIVSNAVGTGIRANFTGSAKTRVKRVAEVWKEWSESTEIDAEGNSDLYGLEALIMGAVVESGEIFVRRRKKRSKDNLQVPLQIQLLESDFLDRSKDGTTKGGNEIINGIEFNSEGKRVAYWLFEDHPGRSTPIPSVSSQRISASEIIHVFRKQRPGQDFGVSFYAPVMIQFRELDVYMDATLKKQQVSALFAAFVYDNGEELENDAGMTADEELLEKMDVGTIEVLPQGKDIKFSNPPSATDYPAFVRTCLLSISAGMGVTYESLTGDYSQVNYSSGRMGGKEMHKNIDQWQDRILIAQFLFPLWKWFVEAYETAGGNAEKVKPIWTKPAREMLDPSKEVPANQKAVASGFKTLSEVIRSYGKDPEIVFQERADELKVLDQLGIKTEGDPRINKSEEVENAEKDNGENSES